MSARKRRALFHCGKCRKRYSNPLGHVCTVKTDYKRKSAKARKDEAAARRAAARKARPEHRYTACRDEGCKRTGCLAYREGRRDGYEDGYAEGFPDGLAACPRPHK